MAFDVLQIMFYGYRLAEQIKSWQGGKALYTGHPLNGWNPALQYGAAMSR